MFSRMLRWKPATPIDSPGSLPHALKYTRFPRLGSLRATLISQLVFLFQRGRGLGARCRVHPKIPHVEVHSIRQNLRQRIFARWQRLAHREAEDGGREFPSLD